MNRTERILRRLERLEVKNERLRAIVRDLTDCDDPIDSAVGTCVLCWWVGKHHPECPYQRALDFMGEQGSTP